MGRIIVFGSINIDYVIEVETYPLPGQTILGQELKYFPGGKGANQAVASARLGANTFMCGAVGDDGAAEFLKKFLKEQGINISLVSEFSGATGTAFITVDQKGENAIIVTAGANNKTVSSQFADFQFEGEDILICQNEVSSEEVLKSFQRAKKKGVTLIYNPAPAIPVSKKIFELSDYVVVNETEKIFYKDKLDTSHHVVIETLGKKGVKVTAGEESFEVLGYDVPVVDTTGAGDCFTGALAFALSQGQNLRKAIDFANKSSSIAVQKSGAGVSMPFYDEVVPR